MSKTISDLRNVLFKTLEALADKENPMELDRAKAINDTAQVIINSAKAEVDFIRAVGSSDTGFIPRAAGPGLPAPDATPAALPNGTKKVKEAPGVTITRHTSD